MYVWSDPPHSLSTWGQQRENALEEMKSIKNVSLGMKSILGKSQKLCFYIVQFSSLSEYLLVAWL